MSSGVMSSESLHFLFSKLVASCASEIPQEIMASALSEFEDYCLVRLGQSCSDVRVDRSILESLVATVLEVLSPKGLCSAFLDPRSRSILFVAILDSLGTYLDGSKDTTAHLRDVLTTWVLGRHR